MGQPHSGNSKALVLFHKILNGRLDLGDMALAVNALSDDSGECVQFVNLDLTCLLHFELTSEALPNSVIEHL